MLHVPWDDLLLIRESLLTVYQADWQDPDVYTCICGVFIASDSDE